MTTPRLKERLIALIVLATLLFSPPLLLVVDRPPAAGLSWLPLYLFLAWGAVIALAAWLMERRHEE
ncbi:hypothetical protein QLQ85_11320 [Halomonas sp. M4R5S39]|uniref:hypothetical protein n=1 Tax=Halomonas kalidii TaxID=3043293 RepID=UPI0024A9DDE8|nr:hypothetical protein [Halomonas kalidii]MDI5985382.1 hypothetical protein [Halomonas kalidii]